MTFKDALYEMCKMEKVYLPEMDGYWRLDVTDKYVSIVEHDNATGTDLDIRMILDFFPVIKKFTREDWMIYDLSLKDMIEKKKEDEKEKRYARSVEGMIAAKKVPIPADEVNYYNSVEASRKEE